MALSSPLNGTRAAAGNDDEIAGAGLAGGLDLDHHLLDLLALEVPQRLGKVWSSNIAPANPAASNSRTARMALSALP